MSRKHKAHDKARILIVDDHPVMCEGIRHVINEQSDLVVCAEAANAQEALKALETHHPHLAIIDISLSAEHISGLNLIKDIRVRQSGLPILVLSMHDEKFYAERALRAGAQGYIMKQEPALRLLTAIRKVLSGEVYVSDRMAARLLREFSGRSSADKSPMERLSDRELEVFRLVGQGFRTQAVAETLHLSPRTIESYYMRIKQKLNFSNTADLLQSAIRWRQAEKSS